MHPFSTMDVSERLKVLALAGISQPLQEHVPPERLEAVKGLYPVFMRAVTLLTDPDACDRFSSRGYKLPRSPMQAYEGQQTIGASLVLKSIPEKNPAIRLSLAIKAWLVLSARLYFAKSTDLCGLMDVNVPTGWTFDSGDSLIPEGLRLVIPDNGLVVKDDSGDRGVLGLLFMSVRELGYALSEIGGREDNWNLSIGPAAKPLPFRNEGANLLAYLAAEPEAVERVKIGTNRCAQKRRGGRALPLISVVRVPRLPTIAQPSGSTLPGGREYSCRWQVDAHWRMQPVGPGRAERKPTLVRSHVKGPEDKPLRPRVNRIVRRDDD